MIPKRDKTTDVSSEVAQGKALRQRIIKLADEVADRFIRGGDLNDIVAEISSREDFNRLKIQRLIEEANTVAYNKKYEGLKKEKDRRVSYPIAELGLVLERMGAGAPPAVENPNWVTGQSGDGEMDKAASDQTFYLHNPNTKTEEKREKMLEKRASFDTVERERQLQKIEKEMASDIFKIANSLVMTERLYKKANQTFNTLLDDIALDTDSVEGIQKKAGEIVERLIHNRKIHRTFQVSLDVKPAEKVANRVLGEYSLLKTANDMMKVEPPKVAPTADVATYQQLVELAQKLQMQQQMALNQTKEVQV